MPIVPELDAIRELTLAAELVAAEVLDLDLAAGALANELHELALPFGVDAFGLHRAHAKSQRLLLRRDAGRLMTRPAGRTASVANAAISGA